MKKATSRTNTSTVQRNYAIIGRHYERLRRELLTPEAKNKVFDGRTEEDRLHDRLLELALGPPLTEEQIRTFRIK